MIYITRRGNAITVKGHAGYAEAGHDIVCAGVSTLVGTLCEYLKDKDADIDAYHGNAKITYRGDEAGVKSVIDAIWRGFCLLSSKYPDFISVGELS